MHYNESAKTKNYVHTTTNEVNFLLVRGTSATTLNNDSTELKMTLFHLSVYQLACNDVILRQGTSLTTTKFRNSTPSGVLKDFALAKTMYCVMT